MPTGATSSTHRTMRISAWVATSASSVSASRLSSGSAAAATAKIVMNTISGSRLPSTAARSGFDGTRSTMKRAPDDACSVAWRAKLESASAAARSAVCCSAAMGASGSSIEAMTKPIRIAASVVPQKKPSVRSPRRPTLRMSPNPATPVNNAVATSGITTIERRFRNSVPTGRSQVPASASSNGCCVAAATSPSARPAARPIAIHAWLLMGCAL